MSNSPYTYLIKHKVSGKLYHGSRTAKNCHPNELLKENGYLTSSKIVKNIIEKEGIDSFDIIEIEIFESKESARLSEERYHRSFDVKSNVCYLNQWNAGNKWFCKEHTDETKAKISSSLIGKMAGENHPMFGKKHSKETLEKFKRRNYSSGENHYMHGKKRSEEAKNKTSETLKGMFVGEKSCWYGKTGELAPNYGNKHSEETKAKMRASRPKVICPHCNKEGWVSNFKRFHLDNCKHKIKEVS